jgi:hypothetical protein
LRQFGSFSAKAPVWREVESSLYSRKANIFFLPEKRLHRLLDPPISYFTGTGTVSQRVERSALEADDYTPLHNIYVKFDWSTNFSAPHSAMMHNRNYTCFFNIILPSVLRSS